MSDTISYTNMYKTFKDVITLKLFRLKELGLYNLLNNEKPYIIIDYRHNKLADQNISNIYNNSNYSIKGQVIHKNNIIKNNVNINSNIIVKLILIIDDNIITSGKSIQDYRINDKNPFDPLINFIKNNSDKINKLYYIEQKDYDEFVKYHPYLLIKQTKLLFNNNIYINSISYHYIDKNIDYELNNKDNKNNIEIKDNISNNSKTIVANNINNQLNLSELLALTLFPLCLIDGILFCGNFMQASNINQLKALNIKSIIGLTQIDNRLKEEFEINQAMGVISFFPIKEELKQEIEFSEIYKQFQLELDENAYPVLIYCFSGKTISIAVCIAVLMKYKNLNLIAATAIVMKAFPEMNIPVWLYSQLQRWKP